MDEQQRQRQVESGAGLQESRLNEEFIEFLNKWGPRVLWVLLIIVLGYVGLNYYGTLQQRATDAAFADLNEAIQAQDMQRLAAVADEHSNRASVSSLARLELARLYNGVGLMRIAPGSEAGDDLLPVEEANAYYERAIEEGRRVLEAAGDQAALAQQARWQIATAQISLGRIDEARETLEAFTAEAEVAGLSPSQLGPAQARLDRLSEYADPFPLVPVERLPEFAKPPVTEEQALPPGFDLNFEPSEFGTDPIGGEGADDAPADPMRFGPFAPPPSGDEGQAPVPTPETDPSDGNGAGGGGEETGGAGSGAGGEERP